LVTASLPSISLLMILAALRTLTAYANVIARPDFVRAMPA
jgi:hypothetical protein